MYHVGYYKAMEMKARWLRYVMEGKLRIDTREEARDSVVHNYGHILERGDLYYIDRRFCQLVDHARKSVPDDLAFELPWLLSKVGFLWIEEPFAVPEFDPVYLNQVDPDGKIREHFSGEFQLKLNAFGWFYLPEVAAVQCCLFLGYNQWRATSDGFGAWSYFALRDGQKLLPREIEFESKQRSDGAYPLNRETELNHEIRWAYTAFHLMAQKLTMVKKHEPDRTMKKLARREDFREPQPFHVVTLRRMDEDRRKEGGHAIVDWQWQWDVKGHWRQQWYPKEGVHKPVFIESYIKGPPDKPFKPGGMKIYAAER